MRLVLHLELIFITFTVGITFSVVITFSGDTTDNLIQNSLEAISSINQAFVGMGVEMIVVAWTHLKGVGWEMFVTIARRRRSGQ